MHHKDKLIQKLDEAINAPSFESSKKTLIEIKEEISNAKSEKQLLKTVTKLVEIFGVLAKAYFGSS